MFCFCMNASLTSLLCPTRRLVAVTHQFATPFLPSSCSLVADAPFCNETLIEVSFGGVGAMFRLLVVRRIVRFDWDGFLGASLRWYLA